MTTEKAPSRGDGLPTTARLLHDHGCWACCGQVYAPGVPRCLRCGTLKHYVRQAQERSLRAGGKLLPGLSVRVGRRAGKWAPYRSRAEFEYREHLMGQDPPPFRVLYEAVTFRIAAGVRYTPDFLVHDGRGRRAVEVKGGYNRAAGVVKLKVAAGILFREHGLRLFLAERVRGEWVETDIPAEW